MASSNPAFNNSPAFSDRSAVARKFPTSAAPAAADLSAQQLTELYSQPSATPEDTGRMTYEDTMVKVILCFGILVVGAAIGWFVPSLWIPAAVLGTVFALINIFKKKPSPALILVYAVVEGVFVGGITSFFESQWPGIALQAVIGTAAVIGVTFALFASGKVRASARATKVFLIAIIGYVAYSLVNVVLMLTGVTKGAFGLDSVDIHLFGFTVPLGVIIGVFVVLLGAYSLVLDFDSIKTGVTRGAPRVYAWSAAFGLMVTVIWLYLQILRILALSRR
jgi:uncharacterized YccA/Bax inhibitor family protein